MSEKAKIVNRNNQTLLSWKIDLKVKHKLKAQRNPTPGIWNGLGKMGLIGWAVVIPTLLGVALGYWIDEHYPGSQSWTLMLLFIGLIIGCFNAWHWVSNEDKDMHNDNEDKHD